MKKGNLVLTSSGNIEFAADIVEAMSKEKPELAEIVQKILLIQSTEDGFVKSS